MSSSFLRWEDLSQLCEENPGFLARYSEALRTSPGDVRTMVANGGIRVVRIGPALIHVVYSSVPTAIFNRVGDLTAENSALKARVSELEAELAAIGAGGVESLRKKAST